MFKPLLVSCFVSIIAAGCGQDVKSIAVDPPSLSFSKRDQSKVLETLAQDIKGSTVPGIVLSYSSEDPSIATVNSSGTVTPQGDGSTAIIVTGPKGVRGEAFVKVCLPKEIVCDPPSELEVEVNGAAPLLCHAIDCKDKKLSVKVELSAPSQEYVTKDGDTSFKGVKVGKSRVEAKAFDLTKTINVTITEETPPPDEARGSSKRRKRSTPKESSPYGESKYDHILDNMKID